MTQLSIMIAMLVALALGSAAARENKPAATLAVIPSAAATGGGETGWPGF